LEDLATHTELSAQTPEVVNKINNTSATLNKFSLIEFSAPWIGQILHHISDSIKKFRPA
jgi:hypothetical protein